MEQHNGGVPALPLVAQQPPVCTAAISHVVIGLRTAKGSKQLKLDPLIYDALQKEKVLPGDVIYIEANSGAHSSLLPGRRACVLRSEGFPLCNRLQHLPQSAAPCLWLARGNVLQWSHLQQLDSAESKVQCLPGQAPTQLCVLQASAVLSAGSQLISGWNGCSYRCPDCHRVTGPQAP